MSKTPLLDEAYSERQWVKVGLSSPWGFNFLHPEVKLVQPMDSFAIDSEMARRCEGALANGAALPINTFIYDLEVLAANPDFSPTSGCTVDVLAEDLEGVGVKGTILISVFTYSDAGVMIHTYRSDKPEPWLLSD